MEKIKLMKFRNMVATKIYKLLGPDWGGSPSPPGSECELNFGGSNDENKPYVARTHSDDGIVLWLGTPHKWHMSFGHKEARKLAWFILWTWWIRSTWFGLKRKLWYWALHVGVVYRRNRMEEEALNRATFVEGITRHMRQ